MNSKRTLFLVETAILTALALVLDIVPFLSFKIWAQGGSISFSMIPVFLVAFRWGLKGGLLSGFLFGVFQVILGTAYILTPVQGILDYGVAFTVLGFAGIFSSKVQHSLKEKNTSSFVYAVMSGVLLGCVLRFLAHFYAGIAFFESAIEGMSVWVYSLVYNGSYMLPSFIVNVLVIGFLFYKQPQLARAR